jgi:hypothetical protein
MMVDIKFHEQFLQPIRTGKKTTTLRRSPKGKCGDYFMIGYRVYQLTEIKLLRDDIEILDLWQVEGFRAQSDMENWLIDNEYKPPLYLHRFAEVGEAVCFAGTYYLNIKNLELPETPLRTDTENYPGLYILDNGNILEAHEWMDPSWDDLVEPFGSIYYDIYDHSANLE